MRAGRYTERLLEVFTTNRERQNLLQLCQITHAHLVTELGIQRPNGESQPLCLSVEVLPQSLLNGHCHLVRAHNSGSILLQVKANRQFLSAIWTKKSLHYFLQRSLQSEQPEPLFVFCEAQSKNLPMWHCNLMIVRSERIVVCTWCI